jgi:hypothetical protein
MTTSTLPPTRRETSPYDVGPRRPSTSGYWFGGVLLAIGVIGAATWLGLGWLALMHHVDGFPRTDVPGRTMVHVSADSTRVVYAEHPRGATGVTATDIRVTSSTGQAVSVRKFGYDLRYDVPGDAGRVGRAVATFRSTVAGDYTVVVPAGAPRSTIAIGDDVVWDAVPHVIGAGVLFFACVGGGIALVAVTAVRRERRPVRS